MIDKPLSLVRFIGLAFCVALHSGPLMAQKLGGVSEMPSGEESERILQETKAVLERFFKLEETRDYDRCYELLSSTFKASLKQQGVINRAEYKKMRLYRGLRWHSSKIKSEFVMNPKIVTFQIETTYELPLMGEHVRSETLTISVTLIKERGKWLIEAWG